MIDKNIIHGLWVAIGCFTNGEDTCEKSKIVGFDRVFFFFISWPSGKQRRDLTT